MFESEGCVSEGGGAEVPAVPRVRERGAAEAVAATAAAAAALQRVARNMGAFLDASLEVPPPAFFEDPEDLPLPMNGWVDGCLVRGECVSVCACVRVCGSRTLPPEMEGVREATTRFMPVCAERIH